MNGTTNILWHKCQFPKHGKLAVSGAPGAIRTPDPQIRSLSVLYIKCCLSTLTYKQCAVPINSFSIAPKAAEILDGPFFYGTTLHGENTMKKPNPNPSRIGRAGRISGAEMNRRLKEYMAKNDLNPKLVEEYVENGIVVKRYEAR